jgi:hypothetical protein
MPGSSSSTWSRLFTRLSGSSSQQANEAIEVNVEKGQIIDGGTKEGLNQAAFENELFRLRGIGEKQEADISDALFGIKM